MSWAISQSILLFAPQEQREMDNFANAIYLKTGSNGHSGSQVYEAFPKLHSERSQAK
jgi:hypothetical protein